LFQQSHLEELFRQYSIETVNAVEQLKQIIGNQQTKIETHIQDTQKRLTTQDNELTGSLNDQQTKIETHIQDTQNRLTTQDNELRKGLTDQQIARQAHSSDTQKKLEEQSVDERIERSTNCASAAD
jgi:hypothetical protein